MFSGKMEKGEMISEKLYIKIVTRRILNMNDNNKKNDQIENGNIKGTDQRDFLLLFYINDLSWSQ
jgi:hypothetical protein